MGNIFDIFKKLEAERKDSSSAPITYIIAGLGNPGDKYHYTHHNMGFLALDCIEQKLGGLNLNHSVPTQEQQESTFC